MRAASWRRMWSSLGSSAHAEESTLDIVGHTKIASSRRTGARLPDGPPCEPGSPGGRAWQTAGWDVQADTADYRGSALRSGMKQIEDAFTRRRAGQTPAGATTST